MTPGARVQAAIDMLDTLDASRIPADVAAGDYFRSRRYIGSKDRAAVAQLFYGVLRLRAQLDWWIERLGGGRLNSRSRAIAYLAVGQGWKAEDILDACDGGQHRPARLDDSELNLVRRAVGHRAEHRDQPDWVRFNYPEWLHPALSEFYGRDLAKVLAGLAVAAPLDLRANRLRTTRPDARRMLKDEGVDARSTRWSPFALRVDGRPPLASLEVFRGGFVEVQDEGSQLASMLVGARPGMRVVDFCAGAAGKTLAMAAEMENRGHIVACDISATRLKGATQRLRRAGAFNVELRTLSSERDKWVKRHLGEFDRVLVDAPCTGTGTWRRNPDAKWTMRPEDIVELKALQLRILDSAARLVKPGGRLVYVTCSLLRAENEEQVDSFLASHEGFAVLPLPEVWAATIGGAPPDGSGDRYLRLDPARHETDGFFVAVLERAGQATDSVRHRPPAEARLATIEEPSKGRPLPGNPAKMREPGGHRPPPARPVKTQESGGHRAQGKRPRTRRPRGTA
ncbi:MAG: RsmB/NOP family class I SAM-dependent RNA methyltransferase [Rhodospirillaceae bacterium]|nr:RsmB/NOP family class I SAM-dependent RNA methyltransferase [Rhodospirillaceae bacterium]